MRLLLASSSPRRSQLLHAAGVDFTIVPAAIDETRLQGEPPLAYARRLALEKAQAVFATLPSAPVRVLGADTIVVIDGDVLGKPTDAADAMRMLQVLSGRAHDVITAVCLITHNAAPPTTQEIRHAQTSVRFRQLTRLEIDAYVATGEPMDKAGAYAIQGGAARFIESYDGDYDNVVGLPVALVLAMLHH